MTISISTVRPKTIDAFVDGEKKTIPISLTNPDYQRIVGQIYQFLAGDFIRYTAFPYQIKFGNYIYILYSDGTAHGVTDRQILLRKHVNDIENFLIEWETVVFFENSTTVYDLSLFDNLSEGEFLTLKSWIIKKTSGVISATIVSQVLVSGYSDPDIDGVYALWSKVSEYAGKFYRTGYKATDASFIGDPTITLLDEWDCCLFESTDQINYTIKGVIAKGTGNLKQYNEADIIEKTASNYLALIRNETDDAAREIYESTSTDLITWTSPVLSTRFEGTQPELFKDSSGIIYAAFGDRTGSSGLNDIGKANNNTDVTGVQIQKSITPYTTFSYPAVFSLNWSTDGGQFKMSEYSPNKFIGVFYGSPSSTKEPVIYAKLFTSENIPM